MPLAEPRRSRLLVAAVAVTLAVAAVALSATWHGPPTASFALWVVLCALGEGMWLRLPLGNATISMAITCNFAAMLLLPRGHAMGAIALSTLVAELVFMRKQPQRALFNAAQSSLAAAAGIAVLTVLGASGVPRVGLEPRVVLAWVVAAAAYTAVNTAAVSFMVALEHGLRPGRVWSVNFGNPYELLSNGALFSLGALLALLAARTGPAVVVLFALPLLLAWVSYRRVLERSTLEPETEREAA
jgi:hypothetical protein